MNPSEMNVSEPTKYCLGCAYILKGLPENRCPECGRPFDPDDVRTFSVNQPAKRKWWTVLLAPSPLDMVMLVLLLVLVPLLVLVISLLLPLLHCLR